MLAADETTRKELLAGIASGGTLVSVAHAEPNGRWDLDGVTLRAARSADGHTLTGAKTWVLDGHVADVLLVVAQDRRGPRAVPGGRRAPRA